MNAMRFIRSKTLLIAVAGVLSVAASFAVLGKERPTGTIKDLAGREIVVQPEPPVNVHPSQAADEYRRFLDRNGGDPRLQMEAMRRLGDLNVESDETMRGDDVSAMTPAQLHEAIKLYEGLLTKYPQYPRADAVMYQLARAYEADTKLEPALTILSRLVNEHPQSRWVPEAQFRRGEILFSTERFSEAERAYGAVTGFGPETAFYDQGLYKQGWALFRLARADESVTAFLTLLDRMLVNDGVVTPRDQLARAERELADDAMRAISITWLDMEGAESLDAMLARRGDPLYTHQLYNALGDLYLEKERYQDAAKAFEAFAKRRPDDRYAPSLQVRAIEAYDKGGFASLVLTGKQAFVERYAFGSAFWATRTVQDAPEVADQLKSNLKDLAQHYHAQAQKTKAAEDYAAAARWYRGMLSSFPSDPAAPETRYLLGDLLLESGRFGEAAQEYERTAYEYPPHGKSAQAGYSALVAYAKHEPTLTGDARAKWHKQGIESALMFSTSFPAHPEAGAVMTKAAEDLFALRDFDRTIEVAQQVLAHKPPVDAKRTRAVSTILAHSLFDRQRFEESEAAYLRVQAMLPPDDPERSATVERIAASIYKQGEAKQAAGNNDGAVSDFLRVATLAPTSTIRANAEFDAASILIKSGAWERAIPVLEQFRAAHPGHQFNADVTRNLAVAYQETGRGAAAAEEFERIAANATETPDVRRAALWQAAELFQKAGNSGRAGRAYATYVTQYPVPLNAAMDARQNLADMALTANDYTTRMQWLQDIIRADQAAGSARTDRSRYLAARATLVTIEPADANFKSIKLTQPLAKSLKAKRESMDRALAMYSRALDYQVAEVTTAATYGMAELYRQLAADMMTSERPANLDSDALEQYDVLLEEQAFPFEEKAIQLHQANSLRAGEGVYDEAVKKSFDVLAKLMPARYAKAEIGEDYVPALR
jgi:tetratricopeptide (TPR) repeat protein